MGVIPARGGSTRIPRKNMRDLGGKPLIQWTIEAAQRSKLTRVVVSTEDVEIATLAKRLGCEVIPQPLDSALSGTMSAPVVMSALDYLRDTEGYEPDFVCLLHPTSPFRRCSHIDIALREVDFNPDIDAAVSITNDTLNGAIYLARTERFRKYGTFFGETVRPIVMEQCFGLDIDTWDDLERARCLV